MHADRSIPSWSEWLIKVYEKQINISIDGIQLLNLENYNLTENEITEIRNNVPYLDTKVSAIIGSESLSLITKNWSSDPLSRFVVGESLYGHFIFGSIEGVTSTASSISLATACKRKNFVNFETLIYHQFEIDKTLTCDQNLTLSQINCEKIFLRDIKNINKSYFISPVFDPLISE